MKQKDFLLFLGIFVGILIIASALTFTTGKVVSGSRTCVDSDQTSPGYTKQSLLIKGTATGTTPSKTQTKIDSCLGKGYVKENYCTSSAYVNTKILRCPGRTSCTDGACVKRAMTTGTQEWNIVFTYRESPLPQEAVNFICDEIKSDINSWIDREYGKYNKIKPFNDIVCLQSQFLIPDTLLIGSPILVEGQTITAPLNSSGTITFLENEIPSIKNKKYVTIIHYVPYQIQFVEYMYNKKYDFITITTPNSDTPFYPELNTEFAETFVHEFMHKLGATDKYDGATQACMTNPSTGTEYDGYDIMCHRILNSESEIVSFLRPSFSELKITEPTAREIRII